MNNREVGRPRPAPVVGNCSDLDVGLDCAWLEMGESLLRKDMHQSAADTRAFTDLQWYMYHQHNVAFYAAFLVQPHSEKSLVTVTGQLLALAPQLAMTGQGMPLEVPLGPKVLAQLLHVEEVEELSGFPDRWLDAGIEINARPDLPMFRIRVANRKAGADAHGRVGFILIQVSHALVEGADSALLSRSRSAAHGAPMAMPIAGRSFATTKVPMPIRFAAEVLAAPATLGHLLAANFIDFRTGPFDFATQVFERRQISALARSQGVRQRALLFALALSGIFGADALAGMRKVTTTYSTIDAAAEASTDGFMRMRMLFARFPASGDVSRLARAIDQALTKAETSETGFNQALNAAAVRNHRLMQRILPFAYSRRVFSFMPYDAVLGLVPPHRLDGTLTHALLEPVYAGAALDGANACVIVPGRTKISFNFYVQRKLLENADNLATLLESITGSADKPSARSELDGGDMSR